MLCRANLIWLHSIRISLAQPNPNIRCSLLSLHLDSYANEAKYFTKCHCALFDNIVNIYFIECEQIFEIIRSINHVSGRRVVLIIRVCICICAQRSTIRYHTTSGQAMIGCAICHLYMQLATDVPYLVERTNLYQNTHTHTHTPNIFIVLLERPINPHSSMFNTDECGSHM